MGADMGFIGDIIGGIGANKAAKAEAAQSKEALALQEKMFNTVRNDQMPYQTVGYGALNQLASVYGLPTYNPANTNTAYQQAIGAPQQSTVMPQGQTNTLATAGQAAPMSSGGGRFRWQRSGGFNQAPVTNAPPANSTTGGAGGYQSLPRPGGQQTAPDYSAFFKSPDYAFREREGQNALTAYLSRMGMANSGAAMNAAVERGQNLASSEYGNYFNRLASLSGIGQSATNQVGAAGQNYANSATNIYGNIGQAKAGGITGQYNGYANAVKSIGNVFAGGF